MRCKEWVILELDHVNDEEKIVGVCNKCGFRQDMEPNPTLIHVSRVQAEHDRRKEPGISFYTNDD